MPQIVNPPNSQQNLSELLRPVIEWGEYGMEKERHKVEVERAEATTRSIEEEMDLRQEDSRRADERLGLERRDADRLEGESAQRRALVAEGVKDETSQRQAALQAFWPQAAAAARQDPELGMFLARTMTTAAQLKQPKDQLRYLEEQQGVFKGMLAQRDRESLADELERGMRLGEFATPGWETRGITGKDGKPQADPQAQGISSAIDRLRAGQADPGAIREAVNAMRLENAREAFETKQRVDLGQQGLKMSQDLVAGGLAPTHPLVKGLDQLNAFFSAGLIKPEQYMDKMVQLTTGRKVVSSDEDDPKKVWSAALGTARKELTALGDGSETDPSRVYARAKQIFDLETGGPEAAPSASPPTLGAGAARLSRKDEAEMFKDLVQEYVLEGVPTGELDEQTGKPLRRPVNLQEAKRLAQEKMSEVPQRPPAPGANDPLSEIRGQGPESVRAAASAAAQGAKGPPPVLGNEPQAQAASAPPAAQAPPASPAPSGQARPAGVQAVPGVRRTRDQILGADKGAAQDPQPMLEQVAKAIRLGIPLDQFQDLYGIDLNSLTEEDLRQIKAMVGKPPSKKK